LLISGGVAMLLQDEEKMRVVYANDEYYSFAGIYTNGI
jgi:hypothetical protein